MYPWDNTHRHTPHIVHHRHLKESRYICLLRMASSTAGAAGAAGGGRRRQHPRLREILDLRGALPPAGGCPPKSVNVFIRIYPDISRIIHVLLRFKTALHQFTF